MKTVFAIDPVEVDLCAHRFAFTMGWKGITARRFASQMLLTLVRMLNNMEVGPMHKPTWQVLPTAARRPEKH